MKLIYDRIPKLIFATFVLAFALCFQASAGEVHGFLLPNCETVSGIVVDLDGNDITLLDLDGHEKSIDANQVQAIYVFSYFENPIAHVELGEKSRRALRRISLGTRASGGGDFQGWPVRFVESLVMFYDLNGNIRVHERDSLGHIRPVKTDPDLKTNRATALRLDYRGLSAQCPDLGVTNGKVDSTRPTRVLADKIKVDQYISDMRHGYRELANFQERTYLYARPFLFEKATRLGFVSQPEQVERHLAFPFFFQWSSGSPYHFQSFNRFGLQNLEFSPYALSAFAFRSDLKAHLFHAHFSGDLRGLAGGQPIFSGATTIDTPDSYGGKSEVQTGMNYLLLMGGDFGPFSLSAGYYYPVDYFRVNRAQGSPVEREVLASRRNYAFRTMWTAPAWRARVVYSPNSFDSKAPTEDDLKVDQVSASPTYPSNISLEGQFVRAGFDYDGLEKRQFSLDFMMITGQYAEIRESKAQNFSFYKRALIASLRQDFGDYVGVRVTSSWFQIHKQYNLESLTGSADETPMVIGGSLEFIF